jgi:phospholipase C
MPAQEQGIRPARALPYVLHAHGKGNATDGTFAIDFANSGTATAVYQVRSGDSTINPRSYTVEPNKNLLGSWVTDRGFYDLSVYGPNGFFRSFKGRVAGKNRAKLDVRASYIYNDTKTLIKLDFKNLAALPAKIHVASKYSGKSIVMVLNKGESLSKNWVLTRFLGWYDLVITVEGDPSFEYRLAGHVETGKDSYSDPMMGGLCSSLTSCTPL